MATKKQPLIVIVGPTASGKSGLAMEVAQQVGGEIICADSRTIYKGMDIGTAKPTARYRRDVPHHLLDVVTPDETFNVSDFKEQATAAIKDISARGKVPIMVGGSGLYIDAVIFDYEFTAPPDEALRASLRNMTVEELQARIKAEDLPMPENKQNPRHLMRVIENKGAKPKSNPLRKDTLILGIHVDRTTLKKRIKNRVYQMVGLGLPDEARKLYKKFPDSKVLRDPGYLAFAQLDAGEITLEQAEDIFARKDAQLAKRQLTWFKRNKSIQWVSEQSEATDRIEEFLNNYR